jgi:peptidoglycan hydrolase-like protein with peptidoglycan-binding domain
MHFQPSAYSQSGYGDASTARLPTLRIGATDAATSNAVSRVINVLVRNGYPIGGSLASVTPGRATYGPKVAAAVRSLQGYLDLGTPDGVVGPKTWEAILVLEATSGAKVSAGTTVDAAATTVTPGSSAPAGASAGSSAPGETVTLPDGTVVSNVPTSAWAKFRAHKAFWPAVGGIALAGAIVTGLAIRAMRKSR